jgi:hypothetical protein
MKKVLFFFIFNFIVRIMFCQNNSYFNDFFENSNFNSSYLTLNNEFRTSFLGYKNLNAPFSPGYFSVSTSYTGKNAFTFGARLINKSYDFLSYYHLEGIVAHRIALSKDDSLALALNFGGVLNSFNNDYLNAYTEMDPYIESFTSSYFNTGASLLYTHKNKFEIGASAPRIATSSSGISPIMYFNTGYNFTDNKFLIKPQVIFELNPYSNFFDFSMQLKYNSLYWVKFSYNTLNSSTFGFGLNLKIIDIGYAYKLNSGDYGRNLNGIHMISISLRH